MFFFERVCFVVVIGTLPCVTWRDAGTEVDLDGDTDVVGISIVTAVDSVSGFCAANVLEPYVGGAVFSLVDFSVVVLRGALAKVLLAGDLSCGEYGDAEQPVENVRKALTHAQVPATTPNNPPVNPRSRTPINTRYMPRPLDEYKNP